MPKQVDHGARRRELVEASWEVIAREGINGVTLRKVAAAADCTTGRIAHYFSGRDELILSALRVAYAATGKRMSEIAEREANPRVRLRRVAHEALPLDNARLNEWKVWIVFWAAASSNRQLAKENARRYRNWQQTLESLIRDIPSSGSGKDALDLIAVIDGFGIRATLMPTPANRKLARAAINRWVDQL